MKKLLVCCSLVLSYAAFAADPPPMGGPASRKPTKKDSKGIEALYKASEEAWKKGDLEAAAAMYDFPAWMVSDNAAGVVDAQMWTKDQWMANMKPMAENMPKDVKMTHKQKITFITDSMASVEETTTSDANKKKETWTSFSTVIQKDGKWMFKSGIEGGWGDMMAAKAAEAPAPAMKPAAAPAAKPAPAAAPK